MNRNGDQCDYMAENPYDDFMRRHLAHYGYYSGKNGMCRKWTEIEKTHGYVDDDVSDESLSDEDDPASKEARERQLEALRTTQLVYSLHDNGKMMARLKEPRALFAISGAGPQQATKWPVELEVIPERIIHIPYNPDIKEPLYKPSNMEAKPMALGESGTNRIVYCYEPRLGPFFLRSRVGGSKRGCGPAAVELLSETDTTLQFEARFESGNLEKVIQVGPFAYELYLRPDLYTYKHTQWFYFRVSNTRANKMYRFTIVNFYKSDSLYNDGMRPLMYSERDASDKKVGWRRWGQSITYFKNNLKYSTPKGDKSYYSLTWSCTFPHDNDTVYFSHCFPYTYSDLQDYLAAISNDPEKSRICKQRVLCRSLAGNLVYVLTITNPPPTTSSGQEPEEKKTKQAVVITGRVHPGESNASWMMKGFLDCLTGDTPDARCLRDNFVFKVVPMLNPDGVIVGNYRCSLAGRDLNRNYNSLLKECFPTIWSTKIMIKKLREEREILLYCDLHGHSRKHNVFIYGCENKAAPTDERFKERVFPAMLSKNATDKFVYEDCRFKVQKSKEGTGRIVIWNMGIANSYTMEATFCGSSVGGAEKSYHFSSSDLESLGHHFCDTLLDYCDPDPAKINSIYCELKDKFRREILVRLQSKGVSGDLTNVNLDDINISDSDASDAESSDVGSDSSNSDGLPVVYEYLNSQIPPKKSKKKTKKERDAEAGKKEEEKNCSQLISNRLCNSRKPRTLTKRGSTQSLLQPSGPDRAHSASAADTTLRTATVSMVINESPPNVNDTANATSNRGVSALPFKNSETTSNEMNKKLDFKSNDASKHESPSQVYLRYATPRELMGSRQGTAEHLCPHHERQLNGRDTEAENSGMKMSMTANRSSKPSGLNRQQRMPPQLTGAGEFAESNLDRRIVNSANYPRSLHSASRSPVSATYATSQTAQHTRMHTPNRTFSPHVIRTAVQSPMPSRVPSGSLHRMESRVRFSVDEGNNLDLIERDQIQQTLSSINQARDTNLHTSKSSVFGPGTRESIADTDREIAANRTDAMAYPTETDHYHHDNTHQNQVRRSSSTSKSDAFFSRSFHQPGAPQLPHSTDPNYHQITQTPAISSPNAAPKATLRHTTEQTDLIPPAPGQHHINSDHLESSSVKPKIISPQSNSIDKPQNSSHAVNQLSEQKHTPRGLPTNRPIESKQAGGITQSGTPSSNTSSPPHGQNIMTNISGDEEQVAVNGAKPKANHTKTKSGEFVTLQSSFSASKPYTNLTGPVWDPCASRAPPPSQPRAHRLALPSHMAGHQPLSASKPHPGNLHHSPNRPPDLSTNTTVVLPHLKRQIPEDNPNLTIDGQSKHHPQHPNGQNGWSKVSDWLVAANEADEQDVEGMLVGHHEKCPIFVLQRDYRGFDISGPDFQCMCDFLFDEANNTTKNRGEGKPVDTVAPTRVVLQMKDFYSNELQKRAYLRFQSKTHRPTLFRKPNKK